MNNDEICSKIIGYVKKYDHVTFVEIERILKTEGIETKGNYQVGMADYNLVFWTGMSEEMADIVNYLTDTEKIFLKPAPILAYFIDGGIPNLPMAKNFRKYKNPRWFPVYFRPSV